MNLPWVLLGLLVGRCFFGWGAPPLSSCGPASHLRRHVVERTVARDDGAIRVRSRGGVSHVRLGSGRHGLDVYSDETGRSHVRLGDSMRVETDEHGGSHVHMGGVDIDSD
jgi:hypothetical protein